MTDKRFVLALCALLLALSATPAMAEEYWWYRYGRWHHGPQWHAIQSGICRLLSPGRGGSGMRRVAMAAGRFTFREKRSLKLQPAEGALTGPGGRRIMRCLVRSDQPLSRSRYR